MSKYAAGIILDQFFAIEGLYGILPVFRSRKEAEQFIRAWPHGPNNWTPYVIECREPGTCPVVQTLEVKDDNQETQGAMGECPLPR